MELDKIFLAGVERDFIIEIVGRSVIMFIFILLILRLSGKKGVRQLTLFEVAIILSLGSAAGDPMFQEELPVIYAIVVLFSVIAIYKLISWLASKSVFMRKILEGEPLIVVRDGMFDLKHEKDGDFSQMEFFSELRNQSVEHLGQVKTAVLEVDGSMSILFYAAEEVKYGLPLFPDKYKAVDSLNIQQPVSCMYCGLVVWHISDSGSCTRCGRKDWTLALKSIRV